VLSAPHRQGKSKVVPVPKHHAMKTYLLLI